MEKLDVRIVTLPPMRVISAYGYGPNPEDVAGKKMGDFLKSKGMLQDFGTKYQSYGFNNPDPSSASPNYGYEIWATLPADVEPEGDLRVVTFPGGKYAVTRFENLENIGRVWKELVNWREDSTYKSACHQWLEHLLNPREQDTNKFIFDLYLPIKD
jgi:effector-binding domain-containing protein